MTHPGGERFAAQVAADMADTMRREGSAAAEHAWRALWLAEKFQTRVFHSYYATDPALVRAQYRADLQHELGDDPRGEP